MFSLITFVLKMQIENHENSDTYNNNGNNSSNKNKARGKRKNNRGNRGFNYKKGFRRLNSNMRRIGSYRLFKVVSLADVLAVSIFIIINMDNLFSE